MTTIDIRDCPVTGASAPALDHFEQALGLFQQGRGDSLAALRLALEESPAFAMAHVFEAQLRLGGRDPKGADAAADVLGRIDFARLNSRERGHVAALTAAVAGEFDIASTLLGSLLTEFPRDVLALQLAQSFDYVRGEVPAMRARVEAVLPAWSPSMPGYQAVLSMHAFGLEENGDYERAREKALHALELEPRNVRAHHVVAHVHEMRGQSADGARWMRDRAAHWAEPGPMTTHHWWHLSLFLLGAGDIEGALAIYDERFGAAPRASSDLIDASALLWRLHLRGVGLGNRFRVLAERWAPHAADAYCAFSDLHAMMAFAGAGRFELGRALLAAQAERLLKRGTNSEMTRCVGLPACRALLAYGQGRHAEALRLLEALPAVARRVGGSQAQRNVLELTLAAARRPAARLAAARPPAASRPSRSIASATAGVQVTPALSLM